jgi:hypothetical protein
VQIGTTDRTYKTGADLSCSPQNRQRPNCGDIIASHFGHFFGRGVILPSAWPSRRSISVIFARSRSSEMPVDSWSSSNSARVMSASRSTFSASCLFASRAMVSRDAASCR